ncbi:hypothetical protein GIB67_038403 [Kingdonia uniflora]|uniref:Pentatricopeptide repeat-containing protein-mitochondrial domain-containing protein n=1 Tax=Kingdonia uniflora TaxID=39325 RepID=A0A7J7NP13_9MAGN|nr:hypothetical protein GIB67_038403 [Kingdonia uniflora]
MVKPSRVDVGLVSGVIPGRERMDEFHREDVDLLLLPTKDVLGRMGAKRNRGNNLGDIRVEDGQDKLGVPSVAVRMNKIRHSGSESGERLRPRRAPKTDTRDPRFKPKVNAFTVTYVPAQLWQYSVAGFDNAFPNPRVSRLGLGEHRGGLRVEVEFSLVLICELSLGMSKLFAKSQRSRSCLIDGPGSVDNIFVVVVIGLNGLEVELLRQIVISGFSGDAVQVPNDHPGDHNARSHAGDGGPVIPLVLVVKRLGFIGLPTLGDKVGPIFHKRCKPVRVAKDGTGLSDEPTFQAWYDTPSEIEPRRSKPSDRHAFHGGMGTPIVSFSPKGLIKIRNPAKNPSPNYALDDKEELSNEICNNLIQTHCQKGSIDKSLVLLARWEASGFRPNSMTYTCLIESLGTMGRTLEADMIFQEMRMNGYEPKVRAYNVLLKGLLRKGLLMVANKVFDEMRELGVSRNQATYEVFIDYYVRAGRLEDTWAVIKEMRRDGFSLNTHVYSKIIGLYRDIGQWRKAIGVMREMKETGLPLDRRIFNSIIDTLGKYGELSEAVEVFENMQREGITPNITTWNSLIRWHCKAGDVERALEFLAKMQEEGLYPDPKIFVNIIRRLGEEGKWDVIKKNFEKMQDCGNRRSGVIYAVLVDIYGQYGRYQNAKECFSALRSESLELSAGVFCTLANAYAQQGLCEQTIVVLQLMEAEGIETNLTMLNLLINAFGIARRHLEALLVFHHIKEIGISPDVITYTTLMKAFIRARKFNQVVEIYKEMESSGCNPDRKAREILQIASLALEQKQGSE